MQLKQCSGTVTAFLSDEDGVVVTSNVGASGPGREASMKRLSVAQSSAIEIALRLNMGIPESVTACYSRPAASPENGGVLMHQATRIVCEPSAQLTTTAERILLNPADKRFIGSTCIATQDHAAQLAIAAEIAGDAAGQIAALRYEDGA